MVAVPTIGRVSFCLLAALTLSCGGTDAATPPAPGTPVAARIVPISDVVMTGDPGWLVASAPTVRAVDSSGAHAVPNTIVRFRVTAGDGTIQNVVETTGSDGVATAGSWWLGDTATTNAVVATVEGLAPVTFTATARARREIARFDLRFIGTDSVPNTYPGGGTIVGGHYVLFDDGSAVFGYDRGTGYGSYPLAYTLSGSLDGKASITFSVVGPASYYTQFGNVFSRGDLANGAMTVTYTDVVDFDSEIYRLAK